MIKYGMQIPKAEEQDYIRIQGGMPTVEQRGKATIVIHNYEGGNGMEVTGAPLESYGTVILSTPQGPREFKTGLLSQFHGRPCEAESTRMGGDPYPRRRL